MIKKNDPRYLFQKKTNTEKFKLMDLANRIGVPVPQHKLVNNFRDLVDYAKYLGWPESRVVIKPPVSSGIRGLRIIDERIDMKDLFYNEKPTTIFF